MPKAPTDKNANKNKGKRAQLPTPEQVAEWIRENPAQSGKREIARAFGLKGQNKIALKAVLKELEASGVVNKRGKRFAEPGQLPPTTVLDVVERDREGGLIARPIQWDVEVDGPAPAVSIVNHRNSKAPTAGIGDRVLAKISGNPTLGFRGRVIKRLERNVGAVLGVFRAFKEPEGGIVGRIEPTDRKVNEMLVYEQNTGGAENGDLVEVSVVGRNTQGLKQAKIDKVIGDLASEKAVSLIALHQHNIPTEFPEAAIKEADAAGDADMNKRADWRDLPLITIDPADAKDHDDAIYAIADDEPTNEGGFIVTVAIADVSYYVRPGTALDREALTRGNSVYFPDRVVPMLPERISNDLCSLKEDVDRPAMAVRMTFAQDGRKLRHTFHRIMMKSHARLAYQEAQAAIDGDPAPRAEPWLEPVLRPLWAAYEVLKRGRDYRKPLELDLPERKIVLTEDGQVDRVIVPPRLDAHKLVEEFMIQANVAAAETLEKRKQALIYRVHEQPSMSKIESLRDFLRTLSIPLAKGDQVKAETFNGILSGVEGTPHSELVSTVVLRSQSQAVYSPNNQGHFGLNLKKYAHFTSPIRRYADLIVHRALVSTLNLGAGGITLADEERLEQIAEMISDTERRAMMAERQTIDRLIAHHLQNKIGAQFSARINGVTRAGLFVTLDDTGADGFVPISKLGDEYFIYDEVTHRVQGDVTGGIYQMGDRVEVELVEAAPVAGSLRFDMITEPREGDGLPRSKRSRSGSPSGRPQRQRRSNRFGGRK
ncbi:ribonuclease R [Ahrensia sp. R2A130]|uniref:ribonuclease R n=1 Tax=Ahrensia sp. R2A130 TaxID=744979 RepID=UPI0001E0BC27|nr:ribonuclease R [Ahrensia sp. R2A130]EFL90186.1 ribonuclease R [Ahrensia sp. R2A130]